MPKSFLLLLLSAVVFSQISAQTRSLTLKEAIALAQEQSVAARVAENVRENRAFAYQTFLAGLKPQLSFQAGLPTYSRDFFEVRQDDGSVRYLSRTQNIAQAGFSLFQVIPLTGGTVSVNTDFTRFDDFDKKYSSYNGTPVNIEWRQPLFAFNPYKWSRKIEPLKMQEAQKTYKFQMEDIAQRTVLLFFSVLDAQEEVRTATLILQNNRQVNAIGERRIERGNTPRRGRDLSRLWENEMLSVLDSGQSKDVGRMFQQVAESTGADPGATYTEANERLLKGESIPNVEKALSDKAAPPPAPAKP